MTISTNVWKLKVDRDTGRFSTFNLPNDRTRYIWTFAKLKRENVFECSLDLQETIHRVCTLVEFRKFERMVYNSFRVVRVDKYLSEFKVNALW